MNSSILHREFRSLVDEIKSYQSKDTHFTFALNDSMFEVEKVNENPVTKDNIKDINHSSIYPIKKTYPANQVNKITSPLSSKTLKNSFLISNKGDRSQKILSLIKDNSKLFINKEGVSIKDISIAFTDCGEKTIQRELNSLVLKGQIRKIGAKRWSRYQPV